MARPLSPAALLEAWERGVSLHPVDRALMLAGLAEPTPPEVLLALPIGEQDRRLLAQRQASFGDRMACLVDCPACGETQEFDVSATSLIGGIGSVDPAEELEVDGWRVRLRALGPVQLAEAARCETPEAAAATLVAGAVETATDPHGARADTLPAALWPIIERAVATRESAAEVALDVTCIDCGHGWTVGFDAGAYLWSEIEAAARALLRDLVALAERFGWSEASLLAMTPARRQAYLDLAGAA